jgi:hypothetical protein
MRALEQKAFTSIERWKRDLFRKFDEPPAIAAASVSLMAAAAATIASRFGVSR